jgi:hypothetical protein
MIRLHYHVILGLVWWEFISTQEYIQSIKSSREYNPITQVLPSPKERLHRTKIFYKGIKSSDQTSGYN